MLVGCGGTSAGAASASAEAEKIVSELALGDKVSAVEDRIVKGLFFFDEGMVEEARVYVSNDKKADIVGVFKTNNVGGTEEKINAYLATLKGQMESYAPDEVFKVDNAIIQSKGDMVYLVIADDIEKAGSVVSSLTK